MIYAIPLTFFIALIVAAALQKWAGLTWPGAEKTLQALLAGAALTYLPALVHSFRSGEISLGPRLFWRWQQPFFFWVAVILHGVGAIIIAGAMLYLLFNS